MSNTLLPNQRPMSSCCFECCIFMLKYVVKHEKFKHKKVFVAKILIYLHPKVADFDGDVVRCRFASGSDECASVCSDHSSYMTLENVSIPSV